MVIYLLHTAEQQVMVIHLAMAIYMYGVVVLLLLLHISLSLAAGLVAAVSQGTLRLPAAALAGFLPVRLR
jgi:hypothetical protein